MLLKKIAPSNTTTNIYNKTVSNILVTNNWVTEKNISFFKNYDLSPQQYSILRVLKARKGIPASLSEVHQHMISRMSNTTRLIDKLVIKELVTKSVRKDNKRKIAIRITREGIRLLNRIDYKLNSLNENMTKNLSSKEIFILNELLAKLIS